MSGLVRVVFKDAGEFVEAGSPLLDIRPDPTPLELADARRQLELKQIELTTAERELERTCLVRTERGVAEPARRGDDLKKIGAGPRVERDGPEGQRVEPLGARLIGSHRGRPPGLGELRGEDLPRLIGLGVGRRRRLHEPDQFARSKAEGEPAFAPAPG